MKVLGVNAVFHDPAAAVIVDGQVVAAAEEERFSRRKHGKTAVPFSTWELPEAAMAYCLAEAGLTPGELDAVAYSYDPALAMPTGGDGGGAEGSPDPHTSPRGPSGISPRMSGSRCARSTSAGRPASSRRRCPGSTVTACSSSPTMSPTPPRPTRWRPGATSAVMVLDGRGERSSYLAGHFREGRLRELARVDLPHSLGLRYEELTAHLGFRRSSDEYKVMALAAYGQPDHLDIFRRLIRTDGCGRFVTEPVDWCRLAPPGGGEDHLGDEHANLASSLQTRLEETLLELAHWLHGRTGERSLTLAGGVALNCVANSALFRSGPFEEIWVQPAAGDAGTALGAAAALASHLGDTVQPMHTAALGPGWSDAEIEAELCRAAIDHERPASIAEAVAEVLAGDGLVAWFQGRSEFGPRALGHRSLLAHPGHRHNLERLNDVKGREQFRPVAPMVRTERAGDIFSGGPLPSPYMLFTHDVHPDWLERIPAVVHVDGTARIQTVDRDGEPLVHELLSAFERRTGLPVVVNTSLNTAGRPIVDTVRDVLECFGSAPIDALAVGPFLVRRRARSHGVGTLP